GILQNEIPTKLRFRQSYSDSHGGFTVTGQMGPADLTVLNPVLKPLVSIELRSGRLDSMNMRVVGAEYFAFGKMNFLYHDLKVKVSGKNDEKKKSFMGGVMTFFANTLIKNKNTDREGTVYFKRLLDRSSINYLVKIALSGFANSIGVKNNKKQIKRHRKELMPGTALPGMDTNL
ncbi:MAG TPA: hypothetical protein VK644_00520, partial [Chitinophagaceae bacterium]|nr:hypothetical protein [Chitinophagaceae bacterium]